MAEPENPLNVMLQDVLDGVRHFFGEDGLEQIANFAVMKNRSRQSNHVMDELERLYGPFESIDDVSSTKLTGE